MSNILSISIKVDSQMACDIKSLRNAYHLKSDEEAVFKFFEMGRVAYNDILDDNGE